MAAQPDPLRHHKRYTDSSHGPSPYAGGSSFMERVAAEVHATLCERAQP